MWFKKKKEENNTAPVKNNNDEMSKMIDEVLNEQAEIKEAAMREASAPADTAANSAAKPNVNIAALIAEFYENQTGEKFNEIMNALVASTVLVTMQPVEGSENKEEKTMQFAPVFVKDEKGGRLLPAFSDKEQAKGNDTEKFTLVAMPFKAVCEFVSKMPDCDRIIVNPFTKSFVANKDIIENVVKASAAQNNAGNDVVEFSNPEPETEKTVEMVTELFKAEGEIKNAYFTKMKNKGRVSYAFIIEHDGDHKVLFPRLIEGIKEKKIALPITLLPSQGLEKVINESKHLKKVY